MTTQARRSPPPFRSHPLPRFEEATRKQNFVILNIPHSRLRVRPALLATEKQQGLRLTHLSSDHALASLVSPFDGLDRHMLNFFLSRNVL